jgi:hypothetical protein
MVCMAYLQSSHVTFNTHSHPIYRIVCSNYEPKGLVCFKTTVVNIKWVAKCKNKIVT